MLSINILSISINSFQANFLRQIESVRLDCWIETQISFAFSPLLENVVLTCLAIYELENTLVEHNLWYFFFFA